MRSSTPPFPVGGIKNSDSLGSPRVKGSSKDGVFEPMVGLADVGGRRELPEFGFSHRTHLG
jgi:hypothetical protein